jgi:hypothetical protein
MVVVDNDDDGVGMLEGSAGNLREAVRLLRIFSAGSV